MKLEEIQNPQFLKNYDQEQLKNLRLRFGSF